MTGPDAIRRLTDEQARAFVLYARQWCTNPEDIVQEAFIKLCTLGRSGSALPGTFQRGLASR
jgi:hypothetical protein